MLEAGGDFFALGTEWLLNYLMHSSALIAVAWLAVRTGYVRAPESQDVLWKFTALAGIVTATAVVLPRPAPQGVRVTAMIDHVAEFSGPEIPIPGLGEIHVVRAQVGPSSPGPSLAEPPSGSFVSEHVRIVPLRGGTIPNLSALRRDLREPSRECREAIGSGAVAGSEWVSHVKANCSDSPTVAWYHVLMFVWGAGAGLGLLVHWRGRRELVDLRRSLVSASPRADQALADVVHGAGVRPRLRVSATLDAPCVIRYDTIALPDRCDRELSDDELRAVLAHEVAHVGRWDVAWLAGFRVLAACLWLQPLNRVALRGFLDASELACDDWALARTRRPLGLARSISRVAEWALTPRAPLEGVVGMAGGDGRTLSGRIRRILSGRSTYEPPSRIRRALAGSALILPLLLLPTAPSPAVGRTAIFVERVAVMGDGADAAIGLRLRAALDRAGQAGSGADGDAVFLRWTDGVGVNSGS